jgi:hypothetical protein
MSNFIINAKLSITNERSISDGKDSFVKLKERKKRGTFETKREATSTVNGHTVFGEMCLQSPA